MISTHKRLLVAGLFLAFFGLIQNAAADSVKIPEGAEIRLRLLENLSSATAVQGQRFNLELEEDLRVGDRIVVPHGAKAIGTVLNVSKRKRMGKAGELDIQINYLMAGDQRVALRSSSSKTGEGKVGTTVTLTVLFGPLGLLKRGKDVEINSGTVIDAYIDQGTEIAMGAAP